MPLGFDDFWEKDGNRSIYEHIVPEMIHKMGDGRYAAFDAGNKCFRLLNDDQTDFVGTPNDIPRRKKVPDAEFIKAYHKERAEGGSLESLIMNLGYYKNNIQGLRARITEVNKTIGLVLRKNLGAKKADEIIKKERKEPNRMLYGLKSAHTLRGAPRSSGPDYDAIWDVLKDL